MRARTWMLTALIALAIVGLSNEQSEAAQPGQPADWNRFYYYPYVYYPHNYQSNQGSYNSLYYRYAPHQRIPVYNKDWYNFYPSKKPYHSGNHFILDVF